MGYNIKQLLVPIVVISDTLTKPAKRTQVNSNMRQKFTPPINVVLALLLMLTSGAMAQVTLDSEPEAEEDKFLQFEQAFQFSMDVQPDSINLHWDIIPDYYLAREMFRVEGYYFDSDGQGREAQLDLVYDEGKVKFDPYFGKEIESYYQQANIRFAVPAEVKQLQLLVRAQGCSPTLCYPPETMRLEVDLDRGTHTTIADLTAKPSGTSGGTLAGSGAGGEQAVPFFGLTLFFALLGGIILNAMPCVFPVLSIKALSFVSSSGNDHAHHVHGWAYTAGTVTTFVLVGGAVAALGATWGSHLSNPWVVGALFALFLVMGLSLSGFMNIGTRFMGVGQSLTQRGGLQGSFFTGALAVVVATPCTVPFMAPALAVALTQPGFATVAIFATLGFGMALPFLLLSYSPKFAAMLPKPGAWMEVFKQSLSFPMYLTAVWLFSVLAVQLTSFAKQDVLYISWLIAAAAFAAFAVWMFTKNPISDRGKKVLGMAVSASFIAAVGIVYSAKDLSSDEGWQTYSPELVAELRSQGRPVFVNLTAAWCITCHANERVALSRDEVKQTAQSLNIAMVKGDYTNEDPRIKALLDEYRRVGVPTYFMFPADPSQPPEILRQLLTVDYVVEVMRRSAETGNIAAVQ